MNIRYPIYEGVYRILTLNQKIAVSPIFKVRTVFSKKQLKNIDFFNLIS